MPAASSSDKKPSIDVRTLSLTQLQKLAERGSRRAKAELERRLGAAHANSTPQAAPPMHPQVAMAQAAALQAASRQKAEAASKLGLNIPPAEPEAEAAPLTPEQRMAEQLAFIAKQDEERARASGTPRFLGLVLIGWGVLMLMGGLIMMGHAGAAYYLVSGLGCAGVGWLLLQCSRWAMAAQGLLLLLALGWAWQHNRGVALTLMQAAPVLIPACWLLLRQAREPLE